MLSVQQVSKRYGKHQALSATDLEFATGKTTVLIGPSGCGKSTLLRVIIGLVSSDTGQVMFADQQLTSDRLLDARRRMGYVIQEGGLFPHLSCGDNATLMARHLQWPRQKIEARLAELCELTRFPPEGLGRFPLQISGGQRQRVSLMRALMLDPQVLLLDEPLGALDPIIRSELQADLREIFRSLNKTVVMVTHDMGEAAYFADEIVLMRSGRIVQRGRFQNLADHPAEPFVSQFIQAQRGAFAFAEPDLPPSDSTQSE